MRLILAALSGVLLWVAYDQVIWFLAVIAIAIYLRLLRLQSKRNRLLITVMFFTTYWLLVIQWIQVLGVIPWILLTVVCVIPYLLLALVPLARLSFSRANMVASAWVIAEFIHSEIPWDGFPWGLVAYTQTDGPLVESARIGGQFLTSYLVVLIAALVSALPRIASLASIAAISCVVAFVTLLLPDPAAQSVINVATVQGSVPRNGYDLETQRRAVLNNHVAASRELLNTNTKQLAMVVWPENAADNDPINNSRVNAIINELSSDFGQVPILIGGVVQQEDGASELNAGILWQSGIPGQMYAKQQLVPFGEYIPTGNLFRSWIESQFPVVPKFVSGEYSGLFTLPSGATFGDVICFEIANENFVQDLVKEGAQFITVQTNNATYLETSQPAQQLNISRFRAIENQRDIVVAATTGATVIINSNGEVVDQLANQEQGFLVGEVSLLNDKQLVHVWGSRAVVILCLIMYLYGIRKFRL